MTDLDDRLQEPRVQAKVRLLFDCHQTGGRRSLLWSEAAQLDYTSRLQSCGTILHQVERYLHAYETSELSITLDNRPPTPGGPGYWDSTAPADLAPLRDILCRLELSVQLADGTWSDYTPIWTGLVRELETALTSGTADMRTIAVPAVLAEETADASAVKNGDSWYQNLSVDRAIRLLLTQKDKWVPRDADNIPCTVIDCGQAANWIRVERTDGKLWYADQTGQRPHGIHEGYLVRILDGPCAGREYVIWQNNLEQQSGIGYQRSLCWISGDPYADGVLAGASALLTGHCFPFTLPEVAQFDIDGVAWSPTHDGKMALSAVGRPPEDGSALQAEAIAHSASYLYVGVQNKLYRYDRVADRYSLLVTLSPPTLWWRRLFYDEDLDVIWGHAWGEDWESWPAQVTGTGYIFEVTDTTALDQSWDAGNALATIPGLFPGDLHIRPSQRVNLGSASVAYVGRFLWEAEGMKHQGAPCPFPQRALVLAANDIDLSELDHGIARSPAGDPEYTLSGLTGAEIAIDEEWSHLSVFTPFVDGSPSFLLATHIGGAVQIVDNLDSAIEPEQGFVLWTRDEGGCYHLQAIDPRS